MGKFIFLTIILMIVSGIGTWWIMSLRIRKQAEDLRRAKEEARRAKEAKARFLANISHEIRTPINTIMGMNELAMREDAAGVPKSYFRAMMNYAYDIRNASESLLSLVNDLLDMAKLESGTMNLVMQEYDMRELLRSMVPMIRMRSKEKELTFDVVIDELMPQRLCGDQVKLKQIILNLLSNAVKYTEIGGIVFSLSMIEREDENCKLAFSVKDTGIGIKKEDMDKLFTTYDLLDEREGGENRGIGSGLNVSRRLAELIGGSLTCESEVGKGSEFILTVTQKIADKTPIGIFSECDEEEGITPYAPQFIAPDADVLLVDDNPMNLTVVKGLLRGTKVFVSTATSGEECLKKLKDTRFNIVLLNLVMPGMSGEETLEEIRRGNPELPVYALTDNLAFGEAYYKSKGFTGYLMKPIDGKTLETIIMKHLPEKMMEKCHGRDE